MLKKSLRYIMLFIVSCQFGIVSAQTDSVHVTHHLDEVPVVAASKSDYYSINPQYSISKDDFLQSNIADITSVLRHLPGINLRDYGGTGGMKTVSVRGLGTYHTGVALDGLLLSNVQTGAVDMQQFSISELSAISLDAIGDDDIFMPARNAMCSSLLNISTIDSLDNSVMLEKASWNHYSAAAQIGKSFAKTSYHLKAGFTTADNDYPFTVFNGSDTHKERRVNSDMKHGFVNFTTSWSVTANTKVRLNARYNDNNRNLPGVVRYYTNENDEALHDRSALANLTATSNLPGKVKTRSSVSWNWSKQDYHNGIPSAGINSERYAQREYYATTAWLYEASSHLAFDYSADYVHNELNSTMKSHPRAHRNSFIHSVSGKWSLERIRAVIQIVQSNIDDEHHISPAFHTSLPLSKNIPLYLRFSAKEAFRMPTMTELYYFHFGTPHINPETTHQLNLGITSHTTLYSLHSSLSINASADIYINKVKNKIVCVPFNMFVSTFMNLDNVNANGMDLSVRANYHLASRKSLLLSANYSLQRITNNTDGDFNKGLQIAYAPVHTGSVNIAYESPDINMSLTTTAASSQWATNNHYEGTRLSGYGVIDASIYRNIRITATLKPMIVLTCQNVLNKQYELVAHYPMPGRCWRIKIMVNI